MEPLQLLEDLKKYFKEKLVYYALNNIDDTHKKINIHLQELPPKNKENQTYSPYVVIRLMQGEDDKSISSIKVRVYICTYDSSDESWRSLLSLLDTIRSHLLSNRLLIINNKPKASLLLPLKYKIPGDLSEQPYPFYVGYIDTEWEMAQPLENKIKY